MVKRRNVGASKMEEEERGRRKERIPMRGASLPDVTVQLSSGNSIVSACSSIFLFPFSHRATSMHYCTMAALVWDEKCFLSGFLYKMPLFPHLPLLLVRYFWASCFFKRSNPHKLLLKDDLLAVAQSLGQRADPVIYLTK